MDLRKNALWLLLVVFASCAPPGSGDSAGSGSGRANVGRRKFGEAVITPGIISTGGGGITNSAGNNVVMKSNGTNAVPSSVTDDGTTVSTGELLSFGNLNGRALINGPTLQTFNVPNTSWGFGEVNQITVGGATPSYPADLFALVVRNNSNQIDATTHSQRSGGIAMETNVTGVTGTFPVTVVGGECQATGGTVNNCFEALNGDVVIDSGNLTLNTGTINTPGQITGGEIVADTSGAIGVWLDGTPTDNISSNDATTRVNVNATGPADLEILGGKGGAFSTLIDGDLVINSTASGSHFRITPAGYTVTLTNAVCNSTKCSDVAGTITTSSTSVTVAFKKSMNAADDAVCLMQPWDGTTSTSPTCSSTTGGAGFTCTVVSGAKYHYWCPETQ